KTTIDIPLVVIFMMFSILQHETHKIARKIRSFCFDSFRVFLAINYFTPITSPMTSALLIQKIDNNRNYLVEILFLW
ncbi:MAG: hypothetical protein LBC20_14595, partial [Planctomycetaceae bacterium]|nr:hypothetical protein [Planctomycetaceae bacterium]